MTCSVAPADRRKLLLSEERSLAARRSHDLLRRPKARRVQASPSSSAGFRHGLLTCSCKTSSLFVWTRCCSTSAGSNPAMGNTRHSSGCKRPACLMHFARKTISIHGHGRTTDIHVMVPQGCDMFPQTGHVETIAVLDASPQQQA